MISKKLITLTTIGLCAWFAADAYADVHQMVVYPGFGGPGGFVVEGRVIEARGDSPEAQTDSWFTNFRRTLRQLISDEQENVPLTVALGASTWNAVTDEEGYFRVEAKLPNSSPAGWHQIKVAADSGETQATGTVLLIPEENRLGIISDLDDTILISEVIDKSQLLRNTLLLNYAQRQAVPGTADFYARLARGNPKPEAAPLFYLSASPRQLHRGIQAFLDRNGFPRGVLITKKVTNDNTSEPLVDQVQYKIAHIERLLALLPQVRFVLVGDDGERDPEIYDEIRRHYPDRVAAVWIRKVSRNAARPIYPKQRDLAEALAGSSKRSWRTP